MRSGRLAFAVLAWGVWAPAPPARMAVQGRIMPLDAILEKTAAYCGRLEASALDFVCLEEIKETIDPSLDVGPSDPVAFVPNMDGFLGRAIISARGPGKRKKSYVYDYQCVRSGGVIRETRTLLKEDGRRTKVPDAHLATSVVVFAKALLGPAGLLGARFQRDYRYQVMGLGEAAGRPAVLIDVRPRPGARATTNLYGRAWVDRDSADILKIEWSEGRVGHYDVFRKRGERFRRTPRLTIVSEFSSEKNGIRFPTRLDVEEAYLDAKGKAFVRSRTEVVYKDFRFSTVEVEHD